MILINNNQIIFKKKIFSEFFQEYQMQEVIISKIYNSNNNNKIKIVIYRTRKIAKEVAMILCLLKSSKIIKKITKLWKFFQEE